MSTLIDLNGETFGRLTVVTRAINDEHGNTQWRCRCTCGNRCTVRASSLTGGRTHSCGCDRDTSATKHGMSRTPEYRAWCSMRQRCENSGHPDYPAYGGRGITVDPRWDDFLTFLADMGPRPHGTSLDRIDNERGYGPGLCRWATPTEQARNRRPPTRRVKP